MKDEFAAAVTSQMEAGNLALLEATEKVQAMRERQESTL